MAKKTNFGKYLKEVGDRYHKKMDRVDQVSSELKESLEDYQSQGGRVTKTLIKDFVNDYDDLTKEQKKEVIDTLGWIFLADRS